MPRRRGRGLVLSPRKQELAGGESPGWEGYWQGLPESGGEVYADLVDTKKEIREFLNSRRARIIPGQAGLASYGPRRVPGLRREEVAVLAGVSVPYYTRLERGDMNGVSESVLEAIARALRLDEAERAHLFDLARALGPPSPRRRRRAPRRGLRPSIYHILDGLTGAAAFVHNSRLDNLAVNQLGQA